MSLIIVYHLLLLCIPRQKKEHLSCLKRKILQKFCIKFNGFLTCLAMPNDFPDFELNVCFDWD